MSNAIEFAKGTQVIGREIDDVGVLTGGSYHCQLSGCRGLRLIVRWSDGKRTAPCTKGMCFDGASWRIE